MDYTIHRILQAIILEWVTIPFSKGIFQTRDWTQVSHIIGGFFTSWATSEAQEYWSGQPIASPADILDWGIELGTPYYRRLFTVWATREAHCHKTNQEMWDWENNTSGGGNWQIKHMVQKNRMCILSCVQLFATPWTIDHQAPLSIGFCRQEYWSGLPFPSPGYLPYPS